MSDKPAFTNHIATFGHVRIEFQRNQEGELKDIIDAWIYTHDLARACDCFNSLQSILTALNSSYEELISNCKDIKDL